MPIWISTSSTNNVLQRADYPCVQFSSCWLFFLHELIRVEDARRRLRKTVLRQPWGVNPSPRSLEPRFSCHVIAVCWNNGWQTSLPVGVAFPGKIRAPFRWDITTDPREKKTPSCRRTSSGKNLPLCVMSN